MASIDKKENNISNDISLEEAKKEVNVLAANVKNILSKSKDQDMRSLSDNDKRELRNGYLKMANLSKIIIQRTTSDADKELYQKYYDKASKRAAEFGSSVRASFPKTSFDDVAGLDEVKKLVKSFLFIVKNPEISKHYNLEGGLGMLMYGAPGTGKTMFAEAAAHELNLPLFILTPAEIFKPHVGESEASVKNLFDDMDACPGGCILFVDECESIFSARKEDTQDYKAAVTTELLQRLNGFGNDGSKRIIMAATNRPDQIDKAYLRFKRFSHHIHITPPDDVAIRKIIESKLKKLKDDLKDITIDDLVTMTKEHTEVVDSYGIARKVAYYSSADICGIIEETCRLAIERMIELDTTMFVPLTRDMFEKSFEKIKPSISLEQLKLYDNFEEEFSKK